MRLCEHFHWTPNELMEQPAPVIADFMSILELDAQKERA